MKRRELLANAVALAATYGGMLWAPYARATSKTGHDTYFSNLNNLLKEQGPGRPVLIIDRDRMDRNIDVIAQSVGVGKTYRAVVKSLPSVPLLRYVTQRAKTKALMVFHQPFLNEVARSFPTSDALLGKPMPVAAARTFYQKLNRTKNFDPSTQVQWLIDTQERLLQYQALARELGVRIRVNCEIDVGLKRGGFANPEQLGVALNTIGRDDNISFSGLMGYEAHLTGRKADIDHPAVREVLAIYRGHLDRVRLAGIDPSSLTLNGAGSHTLKIYEQDKLMNDLSAGSGVVMPTDFDTFHLADHAPAIFIATPILKRYRTNPVLSSPPEDMQQIYYIYGGYWKAKMASPSHVSEPIYESTNQSPIGTSADISLDVDDYMFMRPTQSEFVMLQFGDILTISKGKLDERWPVFHQTG